MRVAPVGLDGVGDPFRLACEAAAVTHGHPTGYLAAGAFAAMIDGVMRGRPLTEAVDAAGERLTGEPGATETLDALDAAVALARSDRPATLAAVEGLGAGWVTEEVLAIAVYCALVAGDDVERGVRLAVNHGGDSDSLGARECSRSGVANLATPSSRSIDTSTPSQSLD